MSETTTKGKISALILGIGLGISIVGVPMTGLALTVWPTALHFSEMLSFTGFTFAIFGLTGLLFSEGFRE